MILQLLLYIEQVHSHTSSSVSKTHRVTKCDAIPIRPKHYTTIHDLQIFKVTNFGHRYQSCYNNEIASFTSRTMHWVQLCTTARNKSALNRLHHANRNCIAVSKTYTTRKVVNTISNCNFFKICTTTPMSAIGIFATACAISNWCQSRQCVEHGFLDSQFITSRKVPLSSNKSFCAQLCLIFEQCFEHDFACLLATVSFHDTSPQRMRYCKLI